MKEKPRFFCDYCGSEVPQEARDCPICGRSFASVRCPSCGLIGDGGIFAEGCPKCGYSLSPKPKQENSETRVQQKPDIPPSRGPSVGALPLWVYIVTGILFFGVLMVLYLSTV